MTAPPCDPAEVGCVIGSGIGGMSTFENSHDVLRDKGPERVSPLSIPLLMGNAAAGLLAMRHGVRGPVFGVMSACASGAHAIGEAARMIESGAAARGHHRRCRGDADAAREGGVRGDGRDLADRRLAAVRRAARRVRDGRGRGRARARGRGARARARAPTVIGELLGYAATSDAHHLTAPDPSGRVGGAGDHARAATTRG